MVGIVNPVGRRKGTAPEAMPEIMIARLPVMTQITFRRRPRVTIPITRLRVTSEVQAIPAIN